MGSHDQIVILDHEVMNRSDGQVEPKRTPVCTVVERNIKPGLGAGKKKSTPLRIFADRADKSVIRDAAGEPHPGFAIIASFINVRVHVVVLMAINGNVSGSSIEWRRFNQADAAPLGQVFGSNVAPVLASVASDMNQAVIGPGPDQVFGDT